MRVLFLTRYPKEGASSRYRVYQYLPYLNAKGIDYQVESFMSLHMYALSQKSGHTMLKMLLMFVACIKRLGVLWRCRSYDLIYMQREALPVGPLVLERWFRFLGKKTIFDYDDALFIFKANTHTRFFSWFKNPLRVPKIMSTVDCVLAGNDWLRARAAEYCNDSRTFHVAENLERYSQKTYLNTKKSLTIGWLGSPSTEKYLQLIKPTLQKLSIKYPHVLIKVIGGGQFSAEGINVEHIPWHIDTEVEQLHSFDIGIMPLPLEDWSKGKSGGKARTYMSVGLPIVCTGIGFNTELVQHGKTGLLVKSQDEWEQALERLICDEQLRRDLGLAARSYAEKYCSLAHAGPIFANILKEFGH